MLKKLVKYLAPDFPFLAAVLILAVLAGVWLLRPGYFNMHDDLQMMRQLQMEKCFRDGQIPCRWVPDMGYGFGFPLFNYYPPLPYFVGQLIRWTGVSFVDTAKYTFLLSFIFSGLTMYFLTRQFWGRLGGLLSSVFYLWAPYRAVDVYVRGAMNEAWSFVWFPLILFSSYKLIKQAQFRWIVILALSWFALFTSHNLMVLIFTPIFTGWVLLWLWRERSWFTLPQLVAGGLWGFALAGFFTIPVFLERNLVHVETLVVGYYEYIAHFANIRQLLVSRFWGYGPSAWAEDYMSFQVGHLHWIISLLIGVIVLRRYFRNKKPDNLLLVTIFFLAAGWFATFMAHLRSIGIWQAFPFLRFVQFPWRFVTLSTLSFSIVVGSLPLLFGEKKRRLLLVAVLSAALIFFNRDYFKPEKIGPLTDEEKFSGAAWELQQTAGIYDYLPVLAKRAPRENEAREWVLAQITDGKGVVSNAEQGTNWAKFKIRVMSDESRVRMNIFEFPNWRVFVDGREVAKSVDEDELGRMHFEVAAGEHEITARLYDTPPRTAGNLISLVSWLALFTAPIWRRR